MEHHTWEPWNIAMKVLYVARNIPLPSLPENDIIFKIATQLQMRGIEIEFLYPCERIPLPIFLLKGKAKALAQLPSELTVNGFKIHIARYWRLPGTWFSYLLSFLCSVPKFRNSGFNLVHAHYALPDGSIAAQISKQLHIPLVITVRNGDIMKIKGLPRPAPSHMQYLHTLAKANVCLAASAITKNDVEQLGIPCQLIPHGVALPTSPRAPISGITQIACVGTLYDFKRMDWVIQSVLEYRGKKPVRLQLVGDGPEMNALKALANGDPRIVFTGKLDSTSVQSVLSQSHIFALPSEHETFGMVYLEAMICGCATIAMKDTGVDGLFQDEKEILYADHQYSDFSSKIWRLIEDPAFCSSMAKNGFEKAKLSFSWDAVTARYISVYKHMDSNA